MRSIKKILYVEDNDDIRELTSVLIKLNFDCEITEAIHAKQAISILKKMKKFDLIISDCNIQTGNSEELYKFIRQEKLDIPFVILSENKLPNDSILADLKRYNRPLQKEEMIQLINDNLDQISSSLKERYIPISLSLVLKIKTIPYSLYVKLNEEKFVKLFHKDSLVTEAEIKKRMQSGLQYLYLDPSEAELFIKDYRRKIFTEVVWNNAQLDEFEDNFKLNAELLRKVGHHLKANSDFAKITISQVETALKILSKCKNFNNLVQRFKKIENFGFSDHCTLLVYVAGYILNQLNPAELTSNLRSITLAALIHDVSLDDRIYELKLNLLSSGKLHDLQNGSSDQKEIYNHPTKGALLVKDFEFCSPETEIIVAEHHELPDGKGFPHGLPHAKIHPLSGIFVVAEDFVDYFIRFSPTPDFRSYIKLRETYYHESPFYEAFTVLKNNLVV